MAKKKKRDRNKRVSLNRCVINFVCRYKRKLHVTLKKKLDKL